MPAVSKKQQRFFGMVRAAQKGEMENPSPEVAEVAATAKRSSVKKFASTKHKGLPEKKKMNEEGYDHYRDNILMRGGDHRSKETRNRQSYATGKAVSKKKDDGKDTALEKVKADIRKKYGKGAIMGEENLEEKKKGLWDNVHARDKAGKPNRKPGDKNYPKTLNVEDVNCDERKKMVADHGALHNKKSDETGGMPRQVAAKNRVATKQGVDEEVLNELGPNTMRNYIIGATKDVARRASDPESRSGPKYAKKMNRMDGIMKAGDKLAKKASGDKQGKTYKEEVIPEGKQESGRSNFGKASVRNMRRFGYGGNNAARLNQSEKRSEAADKREAEHKAGRGVKGSTQKREDKMKPVKWSDKNNNDNRTEAVLHEKETALDRAKRNIGRDPDKKTCWKGYKAVGTKMKGGKSVPDCQKEGVVKMVKRAAGIKQKPAKKTTGRDAGAIARKILRDKEHNKYVNFLPANEEVYTGPDKKDRAVIKKMDNKKFAAKLSDYEKNMSPEKRQALKDKATKGMKFTHEGTSYGLYKGSGKPGGAMKKFLDKRAKMLQKKRDSQSDAAKNNPHFDSTVPSPSGRNKYEQVSFKDFINESSLSRIKSKSDKGGIAIMSASRGDKSKKENSARGKQLDKDIRGRFGRGATKVTGSYMEKGDDGKERKVKEKSHVIDRGKMGKRKFKKAVKKLGKKYGQDSVLTQTKKSATLSATRKGGLGKAKGVNVGKFKPQGKNPEGQSQIKGKTFTYG
jgi:hypothetical protein